MGRRILLNKLQFFKFRIFHIFSSSLVPYQGAGKRPPQCCHPKGGNGAEGPKGPRTKGTATRGPEGPESGQNMRVRRPEGPEDEQS